jgi:hypothetical protein
MQSSTGVTSAPADRDQLLRRGLWLEYATLGWNVVGVVVLGIAAIAAQSVALAGFGLDSLIEIGIVWTAVRCCAWRTGKLELAPHSTTRC